MASVPLTLWSAVFRTTTLEQLTVVSGHSCQSSKFKKTRSLRVSCDYSCFEDPEMCTYKFKVKTGILPNSGSDSVIGLTLYNSTGWGVRIKNLATWGGTKGPDYNYFEWGNLDEFNGTNSCLLGQLCKIKLTSDGSGFWNPSWYCEYVDVESSTTTGKVRFTVNQWLDTSNGLTFIRDDCGKYAREDYWKNVLESLVSDA